MNTCQQALDVLCIDNDRKHIPQEYYLLLHHHDLAVTALKLIDNRVQFHEKLSKLVAAMSSHDMLKFQPGHCYSLLHLRHVNPLYRNICN